MAHDNKDHGSTSHKHHYILPDKLALMVVSALLILTALTVWTAHMDFGRLNFPLAMLIATTKASMVALIFMNLKNDRRENGIIFMTSFFFLAIFVVLTSSDIFFRGDVYVKGPLTFGVGKAKFKKPWNPTPELIAHGKELFQQQCISCHGDQGLGNGPAATGLVPPPRNFTATTGWKNGHKPSQIFKTLKEGSPGTSMASFVTLPAEDRWALADFVASLNPQPQKDTEADLKTAGVDPTKDTMEGGGATNPTIPIQLAMARMVQPAPKVAVAHDLVPTAVGAVGAEGHPGARFYATNCVSCHGDQGEGAIMKNMGVSPKALLRVGALPGSEGMASFEHFKQVLTRGLPGDLMPGYGQLSNAQMQELFSYVKTLSGRPTTSAKAE